MDRVSNATINIIAFLILGLVLSSCIPSDYSSNYLKLYEGPSKELEEVAIIVNRYWEPRLSSIERLSDQTTHQINSTLGIPNQSCRWKVKQNVLEFIELIPGEYVLSWNLKGSERRCGGFTMTKNSNSKCVKGTPYGKTFYYGENETEAFRRLDDISTKAYVKNDMTQKIILKPNHYHNYSGPNSGNYDGLEKRKGRWSGGIKFYKDFWTGRNIVYGNSFYRRDQDHIKASRKIKECYLIEKPISNP